MAGTGTDAGSIAGRLARWRAAFAFLPGLAGALASPGCRAPDAAGEPGAEGAFRRPALRTSGPRLPPPSGGDLARRVWVRVDDLLWARPEDAEAIRRGLLPTSSGPVPADRALAPGSSALRAFVLRTDHASLRTNLPWGRARAIAALVQDHVVSLVAEYGEALDLRLPAEPLPVVVTATRAEFERALRGAVTDPVRWGAFYDGRDGVVWASAEPPPAGGLPLAADLRHEVTHQVLDLSTPSGGRRAEGDAGTFWLWEAFAVHTEALGDPPGADTGRARLERFRHRWQARDWVPLRRFLALGQAEFEGRHYDQAASLMRFLMADPARRESTLALLRETLHGAPAPAGLPTRLGTTPEELEARWLSTLGP